MQRTIRDERVQIPARPARQWAEEARSDLSRSLAAISKWGVPIPRPSRASGAIEILEDIVKTGRITPEQRGDDLGFRSLQLALDLSAIANTLPLARIADFRKDLTGALSGQLASDDLRPLQLQSQLIVRAAYALMGERPTQPTYSGNRGKKKPDILIENGLSSYAVEVKRPTKERNINVSAQTASTQIVEAGYQGGIVIDATDCLMGCDPAQTDVALLKWLDDCADLFFIDGVGYQPGQSHILMIGLMARPAWSVVMEGMNAQILVHSTSAIKAFGIRYGTLAYRRGAWLRRTLGDGLNRIGFTMNEQPFEKAEL
jgi:hypothetical protein